MIRIFRFKTKRLLFRFPLIISFHNNYTTILNYLQKSSFTTKFLYSTIYYHIKVSLLPPFHKSKLPVLILIIIHLSRFFFNFNFWKIFLKGCINLLVKRFGWLDLLFLLLNTSINFTISDDWDISCWTNIIWNWMKLLIGNIWSSCYSQEIGRAHVWTPVTL